MSHNILKRVVTATKYLFKKREFYEGARRTKQNRNFQGASEQNFEDLVSYERPILRARARWLSVNNALMRNIDKTIVANVINRGIKLQIEDTYQDDWDRWIKSCDITERLNLNSMQRIMLKTKLVDGEAFLYMRFTSKGLKLQLIDADMICEYKGKNGVEINSNGSIKGYYLYTDEYHTQVKFIKKKFIVHLYDTERVEQYRGITEYAPSIIDIKNFTAFNTNTIASLTARSSIAYYIKNSSYNQDDNLISEDDGGRYDDLVDINGIQVHYLNEGEEIGALEGGTNPTNYKEFTEATMRLMCNGRNISFELGTRDFSKVNFSSQKASILQDNKRFDVEQDDMIDRVLEPIYRAWRENEALLGRLNNKEVAYTWIVPIREWVQPDKEMKVALLKLENDLETHTSLAKSTGKNYKDILEQKKLDIELKKKILGEDYDAEMKRELKLRKYQLELEHKAQKRSKDDKKAKKRAKKKATKTA